MCESYAGLLCKCWQWCVIKFSSYSGPLKNLVVKCIGKAVLLAYCKFMVVQKLDSYAGQLEMLKVR